MQKNEVRPPGTVRKAHQPRQRSRHRHHPQHRNRLNPIRPAPLVPQQQRQAQSFVQNPRKRMRRIDRHRRQQRINLFVVEPKRLLARIVIQLLPSQHTDPLRRQRRQQLLVPASVLRLHKRRQPLAQPVQPLLQRQPTLVGSLRLNVAILNPLQNSRHPDLDKLVQVARRDRQKFHPLQQRIALITSLLEDTVVEPQPALVAAEEPRLRRLLRRLARLLLLYRSLPGLRDRGTLHNRPLRRTTFCCCHKKSETNASMLTRV